MKVWAANVTGQVEAVVGPYKLYDSSFHSLQGTQWLADEVSYLFLCYRWPFFPISWLSKWLKNMILRVSWLKKFCLKKQQQQSLVCLNSC